MYRKKKDIPAAISEAGGCRRDSSLPLSLAKVTADFRLVSMRRSGNFYASLGLVTAVTKVGYNGNPPLPHKSEKLIS